jgi:hypothetical protein
MHNNSITTAINFALRSHGIWGARAKWLMQAWKDHAQDDINNRIERGSDPVTAETEAWRALGKPDDLAAQAAHELAVNSWSGRHPWLAGVVLPLLALVITVSIAMFVNLLFSKSFNEGHHTSLVMGEWWWRSFNWLPWLGAVAWFAWITMRMPGGWKFFYITAATLALCYGGLRFDFSPPLHGPGTGSFCYVMDGLGGLLLEVILKLSGFPDLNLYHWYTRAIMSLAGLKSLFFVMGALLVRLYSITSFRLPRKIA